MTDQDSSVWSFIAAFVVGGLIGAAVMGLLAPQSGEETRAYLADRGQVIKDRAVKTAGMTTSRTGQAVSDIAQRAKDTASSIFRRGQITAEEYKSNIEEEAKSKSVQYR